MREINFTFVYQFRIFGLIVTDISIIYKFSSIVFCLYFSFAPHFHFLNKPFRWDLFYFHDHYQKTREINFICFVFIFRIFECQKFEKHSILHVFCTQRGSLRIFFDEINANASKTKIYFDERNYFDEKFDREQTSSKSIKIDFSFFFHIFCFDGNFDSTQMRQNFHQNFHFDGF